MGKWKTEKAREGGGIKGWRGRNELSFSTLPLITFSYEPFPLYFLLRPATIFPGAKPLLSRRPRSLRQLTATLSFRFFACDSRRSSLHPRVTLPLALLAPFRALEKRFNMFSPLVVAGRDARGEKTIWAGKQREISTFSEVVAVSKRVNFRTRVQVSH